MADTRSTVELVLEAQDLASQSIRKIRESLEQMGASADTQASKTKNQFSGLETFIKGKAAAIGGAIAAAFGVQAIARSAIETEDNVARIGRAADLAGEKLSRLSSEIFDLAQRVPVGARSLQQYAQIAGELGGRGSADILKFAEAVGRIQLLGGQGGEGLARQFGQLINLLDVNISESDRVSSAVVQLAKDYFTTEQRVIDLSGAIAQATQGMNFSAAETLGLAGALSELRGRAEQSVGAISDTIRKMREAFSEGGVDAERFAAIMGVDVPQAARLAADRPAQALIVLAQGLKRAKDEGLEIDDALKALGITGEQNARIFGAMAKGTIDIEDATRRATDAIEKNTAATDESNKINDTAKSNIERLKASWDELADAAARPINFVVKFAAQAAQGANETFSKQTLSNYINAIKGFFGFDASSDFKMSFKETRSDVDAIAKSLVGIQSSAISFANSMLKAGEAFVGPKQSKEDQLKDIAARERAAKQAADTLQGALDFTRGAQADALSKTAEGVRQSADRQIAEVIAALDKVKPEALELLGILDPARFVADLKAAVEATTDQKIDALLRASQGFKAAENSLSDVLASVQDRAERGFTDDELRLATPDDIFNRVNALRDARIAELEEIRATFPQLLNEMGIDAAKFNQLIEENFLQAEESITGFMRSWVQMQRDIRDSEFDIDLSKIDAELTRLDSDFRVFQESHNLQLDLASLDDLRTLELERQAIERTFAFRKQDLEIRAKALEIQIKQTEEAQLEASATGETAAFNRASAELDRQRAALAGIRSEQSALPSLENTNFQALEQRWLETTDVIGDSARSLLGNLESGFAATMADVALGVREPKEAFRELFASIIRDAIQALIQVTLFGRGLENILTSPALAGTSFGKFATGGGAVGSILKLFGLFSGAPSLGTYGQVLPTDFVGPLLDDGGVVRGPSLVRVGAGVQEAFIPMQSGRVPVSMPERSYGSSDSEGMGNVTIVNNFQNIDNRGAEAFIEKNAGKIQDAVTRGIVAGNQQLRKAVREVPRSV